MKKRPFQIYLDEHQHRILRDLARRRRTSVAHLLREGAEHVIERALPPDADPLAELPALAAAGGPRDGAERHDAHLAETTRPRHRR